MPVHPQEMNALRDRAKFEQIYSVYRDLMFRIANRILHNEDDAEDAVHNAFLSVARNISKISDLDSPRTRGYLAIIAERKAIDIYRDRKKRASEAWSDETMGIEIEIPDCGEHDLAWCISKLPPRYRQIILLKYNYGYTTHEIAELLELSFAAASKLDQRAKGKLCALCQEAGIL